MTWLYCSELMVFLGSSLILGLKCLGSLFLYFCKSSSTTAQYSCLVPINLLLCYPLYTNFIFSGLKSRIVTNCQISSTHSSSQNFLLVLISARSSLVSRNFEISRKALISIPLNFPFCQANCCFFILVSLISGGFCEQIQKGTCL